MEVWVPAVIAFSASVVLCIPYFWCVVQRFKTMALRNAPVVVTSATHAAPGGYPVTQLPPPGYPAPNSYTTVAAYPAQTAGNVSVQMPMPHQPHDHQQMPMPMPMPGMQTHGVAYPPHPGAGASDMNPPTYDMAISNPGPSVMPSGYEKQSAYNPNFAQ
ncbi:atrophin-1 isoform X3 [Drosophila ananassae]|nr:atrophin-1 isoform X3 [Drosophila ananassae]